MFAQSLRFVRGRHFDDHLREPTFHVNIEFVRVPRAEKDRKELLVPRETMPWHGYVRTRRWPVVIDSYFSAAFVCLAAFRGKSHVEFLQAFLIADLLEDFRIGFAERNKTNLKKQVAKEVYKPQRVLRGKVLQHLPRLMADGLDVLLLQEPAAHVLEGAQLVQERVPQSLPFPEEPVQVRRAIIVARS